MPWTVDVPVNCNGDQAASNTAQSKRTQVHYPKVGLHYHSKRNMFSVDSPCVILLLAPCQTLTLKVPQITNGMTAHVLAISIAVGMYGGVFPIWGTQSLVCMALGVPLGASLIVYVSGLYCILTTASPTERRARDVTSCRPCQGSQVLGQHV